MTSFWIISGIFIVTALLFIVPTLLRNRNEQEAGVDHDLVNVTVYRDQLIELDRDLQNDILSQEQYNKSKQELQQRMLQDIPESEGEAIKKSKKTKKIYNIAMSTVITMTLPLAAIFLYLELGDTRGLLPQAQLANATQMQGAGGESPAGHDNFSSVVENLIARLSDNPDDIEGWVMLGRTYAIMGRYNEASNTYQKLTELVPNNAQILSDYADVLAMKNQGSLVGRPAELINEALEADPEYPKALALAGTAEFEQARFEQAAVHWEKLLTVIPDDSELAKSVNTSIAEARSLASGEGGGYPAQQAAAYQEPEQVAEPEVVAVASATESATRSLSGQVLISGTVASKASPDDTVFIYARAKTGTRQPLAILQMKVSDLPASFTLADGMSMRPSVKLSSFADEVIIEARITKTGQAVPSSGDLQGFSEPVKVGTNNISIVIDQQIP